MKKLILWMLVVFAVVSMSACGDKKDIDEGKENEAVVDVAKEDAVAVNEEIVEKITVESFLEKVDGYWGFEDETGNWQILEFKNGLFKDYTYAGNMWIYNGKVEDVKELPDGILGVTVSYKEVAYGDDEVSDEKQEIVYTFKTEDDYKETLILSGEYGEWAYKYIGEEQSDLDEHIAENW